MQLKYLIQSTFLILIIIIALIFSGYISLPYNHPLVTTRKITIPVYNQILYNTSNTYILNFTYFFYQSNLTIYTFKLKGFTFNLTKVNVEEIGDTEFGNVKLSIKSLGSIEFSFVFTKNVNFFISPTISKLSKVEIEWINDYTPPVYLIFLNITFISVN